jgi:hypothetical protein
MADFHIQFPVFDASILTNWHLTQEGIEGLPLSTSGTGFGWPMVGSKLFICHILAILTFPTSNNEGQYSWSGRHKASLQGAKNSFEISF